MQAQTSLSTSVQQDLLSELNDYVGKLLRDWNIPGLALAIVKDDETIFAKGYGIRKIGEHKPISEHTIFGISSVTKSFTAAAIGLLVDEGKIAWDDPVIKYLPDFQLYDAYVTQQLTLRDLLCARSGLDGGDLMREGGDFDRNEVIYRLRYLEPTHGFRTEQGAFTFMYTIAGQVIASVTGRLWDSFIKERFFKPLGMSASGTSRTSALHARNVAFPHLENNGILEPYIYSIPDNVSPGGGITSNVLDLAQWLRLQLGKGTFKQKQILSTDVINELHTPHMIQRSSLVKLDHPEALFACYGLGWFLTDYRGHKVIDHGGTMPGMDALVAMLPEQQLGVVVLANGFQSRWPLIALKQKIFDSFLEQPEHDWSEDFLRMRQQQEQQVKEWIAQRQKQRANHRVANTHPSLSLERYVGEYDDTFYGRAFISKEGDKLTFRFGSKYADLEHWHYDTFKAHWRKPLVGDDLISFVLDQEGKVEEMRVTNFATFVRGE
ncbi:serine hydrolase [Ktedonospora formicarum]|uniref:Penicillin-binding protein n=1 Tax=Ktedonospora formicarum TaxID=2778364 RepID=A0A8J3HW00_9CHLR|nr:serine hydrolase [Ktedonospora formicarum]GHO44241.1 penicillin-binding protein [Ktedonospora formicarum]